MPLKDIDSQLAVQKYNYRKIFHLSAQDMDNEPADQFFTNLLIHDLVQKKQEAMNKHK